MKKKILTKEIRCSDVNVGQHVLDSVNSRLPGRQAMPMLRYVLMQMRMKRPSSRFRFARK